MTSHCSWKIRIWSPHASTLFITSQFHNAIKWTSLNVPPPSDSPLTETVIRRGGKAERFGLHNADLSNDSNFVWARSRARLKPRHMRLSPPCTMLGQMQNSHPWCKMPDAEKREYKRRFASALLIFNRCLTLAIDQLNRGGEVHFENP